MLRTPICVAICLAFAMPVSAQESTEDWDFGQDPSRKLTMAAVTFDNFGVAVRCMDQTLSVVMSGAQAEAGEQTVEFSMADNSNPNTLWVGAPDGGALFSVWPAAIAAQLREGGRLSLGVKRADRVRRLAVDLPASPSAINRVFAACGREIPRDSSSEPSAENLGGLAWRSVPQPTFPPRTNAEAGIAAIRCSTDAAGAPRDCRVESEFPEGGGFGRAAVLGAHRNGRVMLPEGATGSIGGRDISFIARYISQDSGLTAPSRIAPPRATSVPREAD